MVDRSQACWMHVAEGQAPQTRGHKERSVITRMVPL